MITAVHSATVIVGDQEGALTFYRDVLGWEVRENNKTPGMWWLTVAPPGSFTTLALGDPQANGRPAPTPDNPVYTGISLLTDDIEADYATLGGRGVAFKQQVGTMPWGDRATWFSDPWGNEFYLIQPTGSGGGL
ncbi:VOC family protein [Georgenia sp. AZ-5]|uniref:VOC family protein n=1 Tax=Georgenia sp. AZ-5 TaxID=3367526 RepID=UPI00375484EF